MTCEKIIINISYKMNKVNQIICTHFDRDYMIKIINISINLHFEKYQKFLRLFGK